MYLSFPWMVLALVHVGYTGGRWSHWQTSRGILHSLKSIVEATVVENSSIPNAKGSGGL